MKLPRNFLKVVLSHAKSGDVSKVVARPILFKGARKIRVEEIVGPTAFRKTMDFAGAEKYMERAAKNFENINVIKPAGTGIKK